MSRSKWSLRWVLGVTGLSLGLGMGASLAVPAAARADTWDNLAQAIEQASAMYPTTPMAAETTRETGENYREQVENNREEDSDPEEARENEVIREDDQRETDLEGERRKGRFMLDFIRIFLGLPAQAGEEASIEESFNECANWASILALVMALLAL
jgi:hypothetical protein